ncbi:hypothetical protein [Pseudomonas sp. NPDC087804]|uniref:hypothetical protein n=1 Tax=Pseudomonas sp. NPDC087804 TaxID=3364449 RepID=UPI0037FEEB60
MKVRYSANRYAMDFLLCAEADGKERNLIAPMLKKYTEGREDDEAFSMVGSTLPLVVGSSLEYVHTPVRKMLLELANTEILNNQFSSPHEFYRVEIAANGHLEAIGPIDRVDITAALANNPDLSERLSSLAELIREVGPEICLAPVVRYQHWLNFHGLVMPQTIAQLKNLLFFLEWSWPASDDLGNYWEQIAGGDESTPALTVPQYEEIRAVTAQLLPDGQSLLDTLYQNREADLVVDKDGANVNEVLAGLLAGDYSQTLATHYINKLDWCGAGETETVHEDDLAQLLATALILDIDPSLGSQGERNHVGNYDIYAPVMAADQTIETVRFGLEQCLVDGGRVSIETSCLASHLLLAFMAPALLVKDLPQSLLVGSIHWLTLTQAVALIEMNVKGASRFMTYEQVMKFTDMQSICPTFGQLQGIAAIDPVIDWALINEVINHEALADPSQKAQDQALSAYENYMVELEVAGRAFSTPLPSRKKIALAALLKVAPGCDFLEKRVLRPYQDRSLLFLTSPLDLYIEGRLTNDWSFPDDLRIFDRYPQFKALPLNQNIFTAKVREYHSDINQAVFNSIKLGLSAMPYAHRRIFETNELSFFTVRSFVGEEKFFGDPGFTGGNASPPVWMETQRKRDQATGRYGIILYVAIGEDEYLCYEIFYLSGRFQLNQKLGSIIWRAKADQAPARLEFGGKLDDYLPATRWYDYPLDFNAYTKNAESSTGALVDSIVDKLGSLAAPELLSNTKISGYQYFIDSHAKKIAQFIVDHHSVATIEELTMAATELTASEASEENREKVLGYIIDLAIPFKKCIEDISTGERDKIEEGAWGCALDALGLIAAVLGVPAKLLSIASKSTSLVTKAAKLARYGLTFAVANLNPLDGLPSAAYRGSKFIFKSGLQLSGEGLKLVEKASYKLRRLSGKAKSYDLLQCTRRTPLELGSWRPRSNSVEALEVCVIRQNKNVFAVNRQGRAWGKRLANFTFVRARTLPGRLSRALPVSFARQIIQRSLPAVVNKVDHALSVLAATQFNRETEMILNLFLGSGKTREKFESFLQVVKLDVGNIAVRNFVLSSVPLSADLLNLSPDNYNSWKQLGGINDQPFIDVASQHLVERFASANSNYGEIADDLIHEFFQARVNKIDAATALTGISGHSGVNVAPLLDLARGRLLKDDSRYFDSRRATLNADSYAMAVALLSQLVTHEALAKDNLYTIISALDNFAQTPIDIEVLVDLNPNVFETPIISA